MTDFYRAMVNSDHLPFQGVSRNGVPIRFATVYRVILEDARYRSIGLAYLTHPSQFWGTQWWAGARHFTSDRLVIGAEAGPGRFWQLVDYTDAPWRGESTVYGLVDGAGFQFDVLGWDDGWVRTRVSGRTVAEMLVADKVFQHALRTREPTSLILVGPEHSGPNAARVDVVATELDRLGVKMRVYGTETSTTLVRIEDTSGIAGLIERESDGTFRKPFRRVDRT